MTSSFSVMLECFVLQSCRLKIEDWKIEKTQVLKIRGQGEFIQVFHSEGNKGDHLVTVGACITDICICRSEIGSKTIGMGDNENDKQIMVGDSE